ncbi:zinc-finger-containing protein [Bacillus thuringiensis]|uniref:zinc-finger-containing protein n=1 Tax=Bacillus thuringiensis TaxID=1428 RepID=UPI000BFC9FFA|nr:zinc-finger-containing protein [Bacillus thuringiensis]PGT89808.1 hypothetical protein COD17_08650 [Bacillus thuringiensis]
MQIPKECPYCGSEVVFTSNKELYGKEYGNGKCYLCRNCKASVGTHNGTKNPLGILATHEMRVLKKACHDLFDVVWKSRTLHRSTAYMRLAGLLGIAVADCHFGHFQTDMLLKAIGILSNPNWYVKQPVQLNK